MAKRIMTTIRIDTEVKYFSEQVAAANHRSFSNLIEFLLSKEIAEMKRQGFNFKYNPAYPEFVGGSGKDEKLIDEYEEYLNKH
jgi:antitoxin component of RelBE/YafQ-DinJ toxin-antitoxin module